MRTTLSLLTLAALAIPCFAEVETLEWDAGPEPDIAGYKLKVGRTSGAYSMVTFTPGTRLAITTEKNGFYYAVVTAVNTSGLESVASDELVFSSSNIPPGQLKKPRKVIP